MRKFVALLCAAALAVSLTACGEKASSPAATATPEPAATATPEADTGETGGTDSTADAGDTGMAQPDAELSTLVDSIYADYEVSIMTMTKAVDLSDAAWAKQYTGLDDVSQIEAAVASEAAIGSQAYSLVLVRVAEGADAAQVADEMAAGINPAKWICAQADDIMVGAAGNVAMLVMVDSQLGIPAQSVADAFVAAAGEGASAWVPETVGQPEGIPAGEDSGAELQPAG